ncbi:NAD(P)H-binding protein [Litoribacter ruber]|uniref:NAD(P)H-binding protein n=1 Tax=Litoribacter ruber TaxID=702568 RepID=A0AAP2CGY3_9BACT|nr:MULTISPECIES: NAD(P)H-binding protein [Litoribacter]MBS9522435.1 NAD(P)H-binding protein [Litoribacter alkaliphilus]MBT0810955.1 NAD(P)H-binding protein [Litoribacter ruber]
MIISVIGLGWLGLPLARHMEQKGFEVKGSTTSMEKLEKLKGEKLEPFLFNLTPHPTGQKFGNLFQTDVLIINIPPGTRSKPDTFHPEQAKYLKALAEQHGVKKIIYISSSSIYPSSEGIYEESFGITEHNTGNRALLKAENLLAKDAGYDLTILRCGGLMGGKRVPGKYFSGKENVDGNIPVNYIHQQDVIGIIDWIITENKWNNIFNAVSPQHPLRKEIYLHNAQNMGFPPPISFSQNYQQRIISSEKLLVQGFKFQFPDPMKYTYSSE